MSLDDPQKLVALVFGAVLSVVGLLGFGLGSGAYNLLGIFGVNMLHNIVHLGSGLLGVVAAVGMSGMYARDYNRVLGVVYALVTVLGFAMPGLVQQLLNINGPDNYLHLALAVVFLGVGFGVQKGVESELF